jgi:hypothetical protein
VLDELVAVLGRHGERDVSSRWRARDECGKNLQDECRNGRSGVPRGAVCERRLAVPTHSSGAITWTSALAGRGRHPERHSKNRLGEPFVGSPNSSPRVEIPDPRSSLAPYAATAPRFVRRSGCE